MKFLFQNISDLESLGISESFGIYIWTFTHFAASSTNKTKIDKNLSNNQIKLEGTILL